ncbi:uncharacterized protein [Diadema antillarum]|uniref:uncharacterized protein n=1 Tax=Diadema antillarum TaxID=105358 RepID=UPI003A874F96
MEGTLQQVRMAVESGRTDVIRLAIDAHSPKQKAGRNAKMDAKLMDALNTVNPGHGTMLHLAAKLGNADVVRALLVSGVDPSIKDEKGNTPYDVAKSSTQVTMVFHDVLLQSIAQSKMEQVKQLLSSGMDINFKDESTGGNTALHWAASFSGVDMVRLLLEHNPDVNVMNSDGTTPLHDAVLRGDLDIVRELVQHGADANVKATGGTSVGKTPLDLAEDSQEMKGAMVPPVIMNGHTTNGTKEEEKDDAAVSFISVTVEEEKEETDKEASIVEDSAVSVDVASEQDVSPRVSTPTQDDADDADNEEEVEEEEEEEEVEDDPRLAFLWPHPQELIQKNGPRFVLSQDFSVQLAAVPQSGNLEPMVDLWTIQSAVLMEKGYRCVLENASVCIDPMSEVVCNVNPLPFNRAESYRISVREKMVRITASDLPGLWHATSTFVQLVQLCDKEGIPQLEISDWPSVKRRGVLLDLSAGRVPRMDTLLHLVNIFAKLKYNELHLYVKAYKDCPIQDTMPYTASELLDLEVFCQWRFITLVPTIDLMEGSDLSPALFSIFQQVLSRFGSAKVVNIGPNLTRKLLDSVPIPGADDTPSEAVESGSPTEAADTPKKESTGETSTPADSTSATDSGTADTSPDSEGQTPVTEEVDAPRPAPFILSIQDQLRLIGVSHSQTPLFCANVLSTEESAFRQLPVGSLVMLYGSKSNSDFRKAGRKLLANGQGFYVCPGTGVWNSLGGVPEGAIQNISNALKTATSNPNSVGLLLTNWAGCTYSNHPVFSWPAFITTSGFAWKSATSLEFTHANLPALLNLHMLQNQDSPLGEVILEIGRIDTYLTKAAANQMDVPISSSSVTLPAREGSFLCRMIQDADSVDLEHVTLEVISNAMRRLRKSQTSLSAVDKIKLDRRVYIQVHLTLDVMMWACKLVRSLVIAGKKPNAAQSGFNLINVGLANLPATSKTDIANKLLSMMDEYRRVWLDQCFQSGLEESGIFFKGVLKHLVPENAEHTKE